MSGNWITDRVPTEADADPCGQVLARMGLLGPRDLADAYLTADTYMHWSVIKKETPWHRTIDWVPPAEPAPPAEQDPNGIDQHRVFHATGSMKSTMNGTTVLSAKDPDFEITVYPTREFEGDDFVYRFYLRFPLGHFVDAQLFQFRGFRGHAYGTQHEALTDFAYWLELAAIDCTLSGFDPQTTLVSLYFAECIRKARSHLSQANTQNLSTLRDTFRMAVDSTHNERFVNEINAIRYTAESKSAAEPTPEPPAEQDPNGIDQHSPGSKLDARKTRPDLVLGGFSRALNAVAQVGTYGATKYTPNGWRVVPDGIQRYSDAMIRHYLAYRDIEERDPESNFLHAAHLAWNALARLELILQKMEG